jgi:hypothetical protein
MFVTTYRSHQVWFLSFIVTKKKKTTPGLLVTKIVGGALLLKLTTSSTGERSYHMVVCGQTARVVGMKL